MNFNLDYVDCSFWFYYLTKLSWELLKTLSQQIQWNRIDRYFWLKNTLWQTKIQLVSWLIQKTYKTVVLLSVDSLFFHGKIRNISLIILIDYWTIYFENCISHDESNQIDNRWWLWLTELTRIRLCLVITYNDRI